MAQTAKDPKTQATAGRLTKALQLAGMKKVHLAEGLSRKLDCDFEYARRCVKRWTNGYHRPRPETLAAIAEVMAEFAEQPVEVFRAALELDGDEDDEESVAEQRKLFRQRLVSMADELFDEVVAANAQRRDGAKEPA